MKTKMKMTLMLLLFPLLLFLVAHADASGETDLKCSQRTEAELGKDVTLDCYCEPRCHVTHKVLRWKFKQKTNVLAYIGTSDTKHQAAQFKGRAQVSSTERLKDGNFPVTISKVRKSDEGNYTCRVGRKTCRVELKVKKEDKQTSDGAQGGNIPTTSGGLSTGDIIGIVVGALVGAVIGALVTWKFHEKCRTQRGGERDGEEPQRDKYQRGRTEPPTERITLVL